MPANETGINAESFDRGDKLYQQRARKALPLLVRQAQAQQTIYYEALADELGMENPRNLNYVLGSIGNALRLLGEKKKKDVPLIQCLVINQADEMPGEGIGWFIEKEQFKKMSKRLRRGLVEAQLQKVFSYDEWDTILADFGLAPVPSDFSGLIRGAHEAGRGGGESEYHRLLKERIASNPSLLGLPKTVACGVTEYGLPSGDVVDVLFRSGDEWIGVEVKSHISEDVDIVRGIFQCVKYQAVLEAFLSATNRPQNVRVVLVLGRPVPPAILSLKNLLGVEVIVEQIASDLL